MADYEKVFCSDYIHSTPLESLRNERNRWYSEIQPQFYSTSYTNPAYTVKLFGKELGPLLSTLYISYRRYLDYALTHKRFMMEKHNRVFLEIYRLIQREGLEEKSLKDLVTRLDREKKLEDFCLDVKHPIGIFIQPLVRTDDLQGTQHVRSQFAVPPFYFISIIIQPIRFITMKN